MWEVDGVGKEQVGRPGSGLLNSLDEIVHLEAGNSRAEEDTQISLIYILKVKLIELNG